MKKTLNRKGFTLIETMLVVGMIVVLASATYFSVSAYINHANEQARQAALRGTVQDQAADSVRAILGATITGEPSDDDEGNGIGSGTVTTPVPTAEPTAEPTEAPTAAPTVVPTTEPTVVPTTAPTTAPTTNPTATPTSRPSGGNSNRGNRNWWDELWDWLTGNYGEDDTVVYNFDPSIGRPANGTLYENDGEGTNPIGVTTDTWGYRQYGTNTAVGGGGINFSSSSISFVVVFPENTVITQSTLPMTEIADGVYRVNATRGNIWYWGYNYTSYQGSVIDQDEVYVVEYSK